MIGTGLSLTKRMTYIIKLTFIGSVVKMLLFNVGSSTDVVMAECGEQNLWGDEGRAVTTYFVLDFVKRNH